jgi:hypothetical protein
MSYLRYVYLLAHSGSTFSPRNTNIIICGIYILVVLLSSGPLNGLGEYSYFKGIILKIYIFDDVQLFYFSVKEEVVHGTKIPENINIGKTY